MNNELERMWKEAVVLQSKIPSQNCPRRTEENQEKRQYTEPVTVPRFELGTSQKESGVLTTLSRRSVNLISERK
jgi:hypothetical protein